MDLRCWNVEGARAKNTEFFKELSTFNMAITVVRETKKKGKGNEMKGHYVHFYYWCQKRKKERAGVSRAIKRTYTRSINNSSAID